MKTLLTLIMLTTGLVMALPSSPLRADAAEVIEIEEGELVDDEAEREIQEEKEGVEEEDYNSKLEEAYKEYVKSKKRFLDLHDAVNLRSVGGFNVGTWLGPGQTGFGAGASLHQRQYQHRPPQGLGGEFLGYGAPTGYSNGHLGFAGNVGFGNNFLMHGNKYSLPFFRFG